ncbi:MAG: preprotein translocase subunit SecG [Gammaproteobacteria bacterium]|nr:preprotein translocase subunit SecG [Gammaproteobacteria bacterium]
MRGLLLALHVLLAALIVTLVLLQRGKGAEAGAGFGAGASGTVFGARGTSTLFSKLTGVFAALFFATSLTLAYLGTKTSSAPTSVLERAAQRAADSPSAGAPPVAAPSSTLSSAPTSSAPGAAASVPTSPAPAPSTATNPKKP